MPFSQYNEAVEDALAFIKEGGTAALADLQKRMEDAAENLEFEKAARLRDRIAAIKRLGGKQKVMSADVREQDVFALAGPEYARSKGQTSDFLRSWYQKKSLSLRWEGPLDERIFTSALAEDIIAGFKTLIPFYHYFNKLVALTPRQERRGEDA